MGARLRQHPFFPDANSGPPQELQQAGHPSIKIPQGTCPGSGQFLFSLLNLILRPLLSSGRGPYRRTWHHIISLPFLLEVGRVGKALTEHLEPQLASWKPTNNPPLGRENSPDQSRFFSCWGRGHPCSISGIPKSWPQDALSQGTRGVSYGLPMGARKLGGEGTAIL